MKAKKPYIFFLVFFHVSFSAFGQYDVHKLDYPVNTDVYDEICPLLSYDEDELFFTRVGSNNYEKTLIEKGVDISKTNSEAKYINRLRAIYSEIAGRKIKNPVASSFNQDVFFGKYAEGEVYNTFHPSYPLNNALTNSICSHYGDDGGYIVINIFGKNGGMTDGFSYVKRKGKLDFTFPEPIEIKDFDMTGRDINLSMSLDKSYIILSMSEGEYSGKDIYLCTRISEGVYAAPKKIEQISSMYDESTPFFSQDGKKLFFSSNRPGGLGGMDIYETSRVGYSLSQWTEPTLLDKPVNSKYDDSHPYVSTDGTSILFTSNRDGTSDIFYGVVRNLEELEYVLKVNVIMKKDGKVLKVPSEMMWGDAIEEDFSNYFRSFSGSNYITFENNKVINFKAKIRNNKSDIVILDPLRLKEEGVKEIDIELIENTVAADDINASAQVVKESSTQVTKTVKPKKLIEGAIPLELNSTVVLHHIYFEIAKPNILSKSNETINSLAEALRDNPGVVIRIEGHTDNVGDQKRLMELSEERAKAIAGYLINKGIEPSRLKTIGYGGTRPITLNRSEKERSANRRVEITVLEQN